MESHEEYAAYGVEARCQCAECRKRGVEAEPPHREDCLCAPCEENRWDESMAESFIDEEPTEEDLERLGNTLMTPDWNGRFVPIGKESARRHFGGPP